MSEVKTYGDYDGTFTVRDAAIAISQFSENVKMRWSQCSTLTDFLVTYFTSRGDTSSAAAFERATDAIAYIMNELVENAFKFSFRGNIDASIGVRGSDIVFLVRNVVTAGVSAKFESVLDEIISGNPSLILIERIEEQANEVQSHRPGLGLLSIMIDYNAQMGWRFEPQQSDSDRVVVSTMARMPMQFS